MTFSKNVAKRLFGSLAVLCTLLSGCSLLSDVQGKQSTSLSSVSSPVRLEKQEVLAGQEVFRITSTNAGFYYCTNNGIVFRDVLGNETLATWTSGLGNSLTNSVSSIDIGSDFIAATGQEINYSSGSTILSWIPYFRWPSNMASSLGLNSLYVQSMLRTSQIEYIGTDHGLFTSTDSPRKWNVAGSYLHVPTPFDSINDIQVIDSTLTISTNSGAYIMVGDGWSQIEGTEKLFVTGLQKIGNKYYVVANSALNIIDPENHSKIVVTKLVVEKFVNSMKVGESPNPEVFPEVVYCCAVNSGELLIGSISKIYHYSIVSP